VAREQMAQSPEPPRIVPAPGGPRSRALVRYLRSPHSGLLGQLVRFGVAGGFVTLVYLTVTTVLSKVVGLPFEIALVIGFVTALCVHFNLQRLFVWVNEQGFALATGHQIRRYLLMAGAQYGCTAISTAVLPSVLGVDVEIVYLGTMAVVTTTGFLVMRLVIFHEAAADAEHYALAERAPLTSSERTAEAPPARVLVQPPR
jgi:putative flippase GtrA